MLLSNFFNALYTRYFNKSKRNKLHILPLDALRRPPITYRDKRDIQRHLTLII